MDYCQKKEFGYPAGIWLGPNTTFVAFPLNIYNTITFKELTKKKAKVVLGKCRGRNELSQEKRECIQILSFDSNPFVNLYVKTI